MKLQTARDAYYTASGTASTITRQLALASIAVIWLLAGGLVKSHVQLSAVLLAASACTLVALLADLAQYVWVAYAFHAWSDKREAELNRAESAPAQSPPPPQPRAPYLARILHYPPVPPEPMPAPVGNEREIGPTPGYILATTWSLFVTKIVLMTASYVLVLISLIGHTTVR